MLFKSISRVFVASFSSVSREMRSTIASFHVFSRLISLDWNSKKWANWWWWDFFLRFSLYLALWCMKKCEKSSILSFNWFTCVTSFNIVKFQIYLVWNFVSILGGNEKLFEWKCDVLMKNWIFPTLNTQDEWEKNSKLNFSLKMFFFSKLHSSNQNWWDFNFFLYF